MQNTIMTAPAGSAWSTSVFEARMLQLNTRKLQLEVQRITLASESADDTKKQELHAREKVLMELKIENANLKEANLALQKEKSVQTLHLASLEEDIRLRKDNQRCLHLQLASTEDDRAMYEQKIAELQSQIQKLQAAQHAEQFFTQDTLAAKDQQMGHLHQQLSELHQQITDLTAGKTELQGLLSVAQREREASERAAAELTGKLAAANQALEQQKGAMEQLRNALTQAHSTTANAEDRVRRAQAETQIVQKEKESLNEMLQQARQIHQDWQQHLQMANEDRKKLSHEHTTFIETQLQSQINNLKTQLQQEASYREQSEPSLRRQLQDYQHKATTLQAELDDARAKLGSKEVRIRQLQEHVEELEQRQENRALDRVTKLISDIMPQHRDPHPQHTSHFGQHYGHSSHTMPHMQPYQPMQSSLPISGQPHGVSGLPAQGMMMSQPHQQQAPQAYASNAHTQPALQGHTIPLNPAPVHAQLPSAQQNQLPQPAVNVTVAASNPSGGRQANRASSGAETAVNNETALGTSTGSRLQPAGQSQQSADNPKRGKPTGKSTGSKTKTAEMKDEELMDVEDTLPKTKGKGGRRKSNTGGRKRVKQAVSSNASSSSDEDQPSSSSSDDDNDQDSPASPKAGKKRGRSKPAAKADLKAQDGEVAAKPRRGRPAKKQQAVTTTETANDNAEPELQPTVDDNIVHSQGSTDGPRSNRADIPPTNTTHAVASVDVEKAKPVLKDVTAANTQAGNQPVKPANNNAAPTKMSLLTGIVTSNPSQAEHTVKRTAPMNRELPATQADGDQKQQAVVDASKQVEDMKSVLKPRAASNPMAAVNPKMLKLVGINWQKNSNTTQVANLRDGSISGQVIADSKNRRPVPAIPNFRADRMPVDMVAKSTTTSSRPLHGRH